MTRQQILENYGLRMLWKPERDYVELTEDEEKEAHEFARLFSGKFGEIAEDGK